MQTLSFHANTIQVCGISQGKNS